MTLKILTLTSLTRRVRKVLKYPFIAAVAVFCLVNVYRGTVSSDFRSSHEYLGRSKVAFRPDATGSYGSVSSKNGRTGSSRIRDRLSSIRIPSIDEYPAYNVSVMGTSVPVPLWQRRLWANPRNTTDMEREDEDEADTGLFYLTELLQVRIYADDKARWSVNELKQWMHYLFLAGVQHIYLCDHFAFEHEKLDTALERYVRLGLVTYLAWGKVRDPMTAQIRCYQRFIRRYRRRHVWQVAVDMDEYPFAPNDTAEDFLVRYLRAFPGHVTEISMPNYLMLGRGDRSGRLVVERIDRIVRQPNALVKPIYRPQWVNANVHHNHLLGGTRVDADPDRLMMVHYWGARSQRWGPDTPKILLITKPWDRMKVTWSQRIRNSLLAFNESDAITNSTGP